MDRPYFGNFADGNNPHNLPVYILALDDEHYLEIGRIAAHVGTLEYLVQKLLWWMMGLTEKQGRSLTVATRTETQLEAIEVLLASGKPENMTQRENIALVLAEVRTARSLRHDVVHAIWLPEWQDHDVKPVAMKVARKRGKDNTRTPYSSKQLAQIARDVHRVYSETRRLLNELGVQQ